MRTATKVLVPVGVAAAGMVAVRETYRRKLRTLILTWGATPEEAARMLPGDELLDDADVVSTRAITIETPSSAVWPWLVQMGSGRAGAYTYDWIENMLGLDMHSADTVHPEWQGLEVGDEIPGKGGLPAMKVELLDPEHALVTRSEDGTWVWAFVLDEVEGRTRLLSRNRIALREPSLGDRIGMAVMEPGSLVMERKMLLGIRERAEGLAAESEALAVGAV